MLRAYCDESGKSDGPDDLFVTLGGVVSDLDRWQCFEPEWEKMLRDFGVSELHMADLSHFVGEYSDWEENKRRAFLAEAIRIMDAHCAGYIGASMPIEVFNDILEEHQQKLIDPYFPCFFVNISGLLTCAYHMEAEEKIEMVLDDDGGMKGKAEAFWERAKKEGPVEFGERLGVLSVGVSSHEALPLQAADLVAYEVNLFNKVEYLNQSHGRPLPKNWPRYTFKQLFDSGKLLTFELLDRKNSREWFGVSFRSSFPKPGPSD